jgi:hypothetical protein
MCVCGTVPCARKQRKILGNKVPNMVYGNGSLKVGNVTKIRDVRGIGSLTGVGGGGARG